MLRGKPGWALSSAVGSRAGVCCSVCPIKQWIHLLGLPQQISTCVVAYKTDLFSNGSRSQKSAIKLAGGNPSEGLGRMPSSPLPASSGASIPWLVVRSLQSLPPWSHGLPSLSFPYVSLLKKIFYLAASGLCCGAGSGVCGLSCSAACGILAPQPGMEPMAPAVELWSLHHWTSSEVPHLQCLIRWFWGGPKR